MSLLDNIPPATPPVPPAAEVTPKNKADYVPANWHLIVDPDDADAIIAHNNVTHREFKGTMAGYKEMFKE